MTESTGSAAEPTLADVLAAIGALSAKVDRVDAGVARVEADGGQMRTEMNVRFDLADEKLAAVEARADAIQTEMREGFAGLKGEIAVTERYVLDVRRAIGAHANDPNAHPNAA